MRVLPLFVTAVLASVSCGDNIHPGAPLDAPPKPDAGHHIKPDVDLPLSTLDPGSVPVDAAVSVPDAACDDDDTDQHVDEHGHD